MADKEIASVPTATDVTPEANPEAEAAPETVQPAAQALVDIELHIPFTTNGKVYGAGATDDHPVTIQVTPEVAEDLAARQKEYDRVEKARHISRSYTVDAGSLDAGK